MLAGGDDFNGPPDHRLPACWMGGGETVSQERNVARADLEQAVAAEGTAAAALEVLGLFAQDAGETGTCSIENPSVAAVRHVSPKNGRDDSVLFLAEYTGRGGGGPYPDSPVRPLS